MVEVTLLTAELKMSLIVFCAFIENGMDAVQANKSKVAILFIVCV
jgi:hypothetical protein